MRTRRLQGSIHFHYTSLRRKIFDEELHHHVRSVGQVSFLYRSPDRSRLENSYSKKRQNTSMPEQRHDYLFDAHVHEDGNNDPAHSAWSTFHQIIPDTVFSTGGTKKPSRRTNHFSTKTCNSS